MYSHFLIVFSLSIFLFACGGLQKAYLESSDVIYGESSGTPSGGKIDDCDVMQNYIPDVDHLEHTPKRTILVNFHYFINKKDIHPMNREIAEKYTKKMLNTSNYKLSLNTQMKLPLENETPVIPIRYRYKIVGDPEIDGDNGIYVHETDDEEVAYFVNEGKTKNMFSHSAYKKYGVRKEEVLNIFFFIHHPDSINSSKSYNLKSQGVGYSYFVKMGLPPDEFITGNETEYKILAHEQAGLLNHEIGHSLGLSHTWNTEDGCEDTPKHPNCWNKTNTPPCNKGASNNMMDYNATKAALTPCQIGKVMYNMSKEGRSQRKIIEPKWCTYDVSQTIFIGNYKKIHWYNSKDLEGDLIIDSGSELTIHCTVSMPENSKIIVKPGGKLVLDKGIVTNLCSGKWEGVMLYKRKNKKGTVTILNNGSLQNMVNKVELIQE